MEQIVEQALTDEGLPFLGWRDVPVDPSDLGAMVLETEPCHRQIFIGRPATVADEDAFERRLFTARKVISNKVYGLKDERTSTYYPVSLSTRTIVYKGMVLVDQLGEYYRDLQDVALRLGPRPGAPALRHQHLPDLAPVAPLPDGRA